MNIKDLKIGTQLKIGFGIIVALIAVLSVISWQMNNRLAQQTTDLSNHPFMVSKALGELNVDIMAMRLEFRNFLLATDEKGRRTAVNNSDLYEANAERQFDVLYDRYLGPRTDIEKAHDAFMLWVSVRKSNRETKTVLEAMSRVESKGDIGIGREQMQNCINKIEDFANAKADHFVLSTVELKKKLNRQLAFWAIGILTFTLIIIYLLNRNIRTPIIELIAMSQNFKDGKLDSRSSYKSMNEFGQLSFSFNNLADTIETELTLNTQSAKLSAIMLSEDDARRFCHALLSSLLEQTGSQMGAVYLLNDEKTEFECFKCLGMDSDGYKPFSAVHFEGEFGAALATRKIQHIANIPEDTRFTFSTISGKFTPREIITIPIVSGNETVAVISLVTIKSFSKNTLRLLNTILSTLSARIDGILAYHKIIAVSHQLEQQNSELEAQKRELSMQTSELSEQNVELEMQKKQLDESNRLKTSFLSNMSHELRTPLNSVIALSGVLNRRLVGKVPDEEYSYLDIIERNGKQLLSLINDILDLSRIEAGHEEIQINRFNISKLINEVVDLIEPLAKQKSINLRHKAEDDLPDIKSDYEKCRHILQNIIANAVKFTEQGSVEIAIRVKTDTIDIEVSDTGIGIHNENLSYIFDEFRQADGSNSRKYGGTGLGLAIAKKYAEMLGGSISVESTYGKGSKFTLSLPLQFNTQQTHLEITETDHHKLMPQSVKHSGNVNAKDKTILLVEDTEAMTVQMKDMLATQGYNIMVAHNGSEALEQIAMKIPDAMILDLMMPGVDGFEVLKRIRAEEKTDHLPVIILTAKYVTKEELSFLKNNGIVQLIRKGDINKDQMLEAVTRMMFTEKEATIAPEKIAEKIPISGNPLVLVVEDNPDNLLTIKALLDGRCTIIEAEDGLTGIEMAQLHQPHLILMDIALPGMNGIEALCELRKIEVLKHVPVIAVSASAMKGDREDFIACGFDGYIAKPIDNILFEKTIRQWIG